MSSETIKQIIRSDVTREQLIDIADRIRADRKSAGEHAVAMGLTGRPALQIAGFGTHALLNKNLPELFALQGAAVLNCGTFPGTTLRSYQVHGRYGRVIIGKASIVDTGELPEANLTRKNGAKINVLYGSTAYFPGMGPTPPTEEVIFVLVLSSRDRNQPAQLQSMSIAALEPDFSGFIFNEPIDDFIAGYSLTEEPASVTGVGLELAIKPGVTPFVGGEALPPDASDSEAQQG